MLAPAEDHSAFAIAPALEGFRGSGTVAFVYASGRSRHGRIGQGRRGQNRLRYDGNSSHFVVVGGAGFVCILLRVVIRGLRMRVVVRGILLLVHSMMAGGSGT